MEYKIRKMILSDKKEVLFMMKNFYASDAVYTNGSDEIFENDFESITTHSASDTISSLLNVYENSENRTAILPFNASMNNYLSKHGGFHTKFALMIGTNQIYSIIERVRNIILEWSITLEENGILGEGLQFSDKEKEIANNTPIINHYINNFWGDVSRTQIQQDTKESIQEQ